MPFKKEKFRIQVTFIIRKRINNLYKSDNFFRAFETHRHIHSENAQAFDAL